MTIVLQSIRQRDKLVPAKQDDGSCRGDVGECSSPKPRLGIDILHYMMVRWNEESRLGE